MSDLQSSTPVDIQGSSYNLADKTTVNNEPLGISDTSRTLPRQLSPGSIRGEMNVVGTINVISPSTGKTDITLDGVGDALTVTNTDNSKIGLGKIPDGSGSFGLFVTDANNKLIMKIVGSTFYLYDVANNSVNAMQFGKLPDGSYGWAVATAGNNVADSF